MADTMTPQPSGLYITQITLPNSTTYEIVDENARKRLTDMANFSAFLGVITSSAASAKIEDGSTTQVVIIDGNSVTATTGNVVIYKPTGSTKQAQEFIWDGSKWNFFGDIGVNDLGTLAFKDSATYVKFKNTTSTSSTVTSTGKFTPVGTVTFSATANQYLAFSSTSKAPTSNCSNYWSYTPAGTVAVTYTTVSASSSVITGITAKEVVTSVTVANPNSTVPANSVVYANVTDNTLLLSYLIVPTDTAAAVSSSVNAYTGTKTVKTTTCSFSGSTMYNSGTTIVPSEVTFTGTQGNITVKSTSAFVHTVASSTESGTVNFA